MDGTRRRREGLKGYGGGLFVRIVTSHVMLGEALPIPLVSEGADYFSVVRLDRILWILVRAYNYKRCLKHTYISHSHQIRNRAFSPRSFRPRSCPLRLPVFRAHIRPSVFSEFVAFTVPTSSSTPVLKLPLPPSTRSVPRLLLLHPLPRHLTSDDIIQ